MPPEVLMSSILKTAQQELCKHNLDTFVDKAYQVVTPGCPHCQKSMYTVSQFVHHLAEDVLPHILLAALTRTTKYVYCDHCKTVVEYEKMVLESDNDDRTGLDFACTRCHRVICAFHDTLPADSTPAEPEKTSAAQVGFPTYPKP
jgi:hypothetical protein